MTEIDHIISFPIKRKSYWDDEIETIEKILDLDNHLKQKGYRPPNLYNRKCMIVADNTLGDNPVAVCKVTTYGDIDWLQKEIESPFSKKIKLSEFDATEEELKRAKKFRHTR